MVESEKPSPEGGKLVIIGSMNRALTQQRLRITFGKYGVLRFVGHLDLSKTWERILRRAKVPLEYTQGFNPRPRMQFAAALQVGVTSTCEYLDIWLLERLTDDFPAGWTARLQATCPTGLDIYQLEEVPIRGESLPKLVTTSEYVITPVDAAISREQLQTHAAEFLAQATIERVTHKGKRYDLRPRILDLTIDDNDQLVALVQSNERANARPDELVDALGFDMTQMRIHRRRLNLEDPA